jgi:hypothetical protein
MSLGAGPFLRLPIAARDFFRIVRGSLALPVAGKVRQRPPPGSKGVQRERGRAQRVQISQARNAPVCERGCS